MNAIHITAHLSLGIWLRWVCSLPVGQSTGPHFTTALMTWSGYPVMQSA